MYNKTRRSWSVKQKGGGTGRIAQETEAFGRLYGKKCKWWGSSVWKFDLWCVRVFQSLNLPLSACPSFWSSGQKLGHAQAEVQIKNTFKFLALMPCWKSGDQTWMLCIESKAKPAKPYMAKKINVAWRDFTFFSDRTNSCGTSRTLHMHFWGNKLCPTNLGLVVEGGSLSPQKKEETSERLSLQPAWKWRMGWCFPRDHTWK